MTEGILAQDEVEEVDSTTEDNGDGDSTDSPSVDDSTDEETNDDQTQSDEGDNSDGQEDDVDDNTNLADHPRWKEREGDWKDRFNEQETRHSDAMAKMRDDMDDKYGSHTPEAPTAPSSIPSWFGGDEKQYADYVAQTKAERSADISAAQTRAREEMDKEAATKQKSIDDATKYMNTEIDDIENSKLLNPDKEKIDRNKLLKFVMDEDLVDSKGQWNYKVGRKLMQAGVKATKAVATKAKKKIAADTIDKGGKEPSKTNLTTSEDFDKPQNRPW